jgi:hypothetical protein
MKRGSKIKNQKPIAVECLLTLSLTALNNPPYLAVLGANRPSKKYDIAIAAFTLPVPHSVHKKSYIYKKEKKIYTYIIYYNTQQCVKIMDQKCIINIPRN